MKQFFLLVIVAFCAFPIFAQDTLIPQIDPDFIVSETDMLTFVEDEDNENTRPEAAISTDVRNQNETPFDPTEYKSVLLTDQEYQAIIDARNTIGLARPVTDAEIQQSRREEQAERVKPPEEDRYIRLGGILYKAPDEWVIWINGERVTADNIPEEIIDFRVRKEYVEIKWFDDYTRQIFPIRLRANQQFHLDARIFLPG